MDMTSEEQWELLEALYHHGVHYDALQKVLPEWSREKLRHVLQTFKINSKKNDDEPQDKEVKSMRQWMSHIINLHTIQGTNNGCVRKAKYTEIRGRRSLKATPKDQGGLLSKVMLFVSEREKHPPPSSENDPDYKQIYRYLSQVLAGEEPSQLSPGSAAKVREMLGKVKEMAKDSRHKRMINQYIKLHNKSLVSLSNSIPSTSKTNIEGEERGECSLFSTADFTEETEINFEQMSNSDIKSKLKERDFAAKCMKRQTAISSTLLNVPGINPVNFSTDLLTKGLINSGEP